MLILAALILALNSSCQNIENNEFEKHAIKIVKAFHNQDSQSINQMIHDDLGLIVLYRRGVFDELEAFGVLHVDIDLANGYIAAVRFYHNFSGVL